MIETITTNSPKLVGLKLSGTLHDEDYKDFVPKIESIVTSQGRVRLFVQLEDFHGWDMRAAWDDLKFGLRHYSDFERIALVGDRHWEAWMASFCRPFTRARVRYFDVSQVDAAWKWLAEKEADHQASEDDESPETCEKRDESGRYAWPCF
jgi:hypothetical protein